MALQPFSATEAYFQTQENKLQTIEQLPSWNEELTTDSSTNTCSPATRKILLGVGIALVGLLIVGTVAAVVVTYDKNKTKKQEEQQQQQHEEEPW